MTPTTTRAPAVGAVGACGHLWCAGHEACRYGPGTLDPFRVNYCAAHTGGELCWYWTGDGCACAVMGIEPETADGALVDRAEPLPDETCPNGCARFDDWWVPEDCPEHLGGTA